MRRLRVWTLTVALPAAAALAASGAIAAGAATSIVGKWSGRLLPAPGSHGSRQQLTVVVNRGERTGTWRMGPRCAGTLRLKDISYGYHHYYRVQSSNPGCAPRGVDCLKRLGAQMVDVFVSNSGTANSSGEFRRIG